MINQIWRGQNRMVISGEPELREVVHEVLAATKSEELLQQMIEELKGLREDFAQDRAERALQESPYSGVLRFAPKNKAEWYEFINLILTVLIMILTLINKPEPPTVVIEDHEQEIVQQLKEINERLAENDSAEGAKPPKGHC